MLCAALMGAALSLCGVVMQGLLRNPLADGSTLGISTGAALGAALSIVLGISILMALLFNAIKPSFDKKKQKLTIQ